jgi:hypothetical protein
MNHTWRRQTFNAIVGPFDLADSYLPVFQRAVTQGRAAGIMYAANELNGVPCAASTFLDAQLHGWGFDGYRCTGEPTPQHGPMSTLRARRKLTAVKPSPTSYRPLPPSYL